MCHPLEMSTPHIQADPGDFAETVLMPGDPLRAKFIAETYFDDPKLVTEVRNMYGYTGTYNGKPISIMGSGMGIPSASIYATELLRFYDVKNIIRIGSCGALTEDLKLGDIVIATGAGTDSIVNRTRLNGWDFPATADFGLTRAAVEAAESRGARFMVGNIFTSDLFYDPNNNMFDILQKYGILAVEMEAAGLYGLAAEYGGKSLAICTVSDHCITEEVMSPEDRQTSFGTMMQVALDTADSIST